MNVLFITISTVPNLNGHTISIDLLHEFRRNGHNVYVVGAIERDDNTDTYIANEADITVLRVKIGNNKKAGLIEKGITTVMLPQKYIAAIKEYYSNVKFDLILYPTPPVTHVDTVKYIKNRDGAKSYLLLKDIFPQNAVDIGMMSKFGIKGIIYKHFRKTEKRLYALSDNIGCMSQANVDYLLKHNPEISPEKVEICPNSIEFVDKTISADERTELRTKYDLPQDRKIFVYGGNLGKPQGIPFIIECLKRAKDIPDAYFLIVGNGTEYKKLEAFITAEQPKNVRLMQRLPKEDYDRLVAACDVGLIFLDHRFTIPNFPSRLLAYMQAGIPVLACTDPNTDIGKVITDGGFGWWCESDDVDAFVEKIFNAISNERIHETVDAELRYLSEHFTVESAYNIILRSIG